MGWTHIVYSTALATADDASHAVATSLHVPHVGSRMPPTYVLQNEFRRRDVRLPSSASVPGMSSGCQLIVASLCTVGRSGIGARVRSRSRRTNVS